MSPWRFLRAELWAVLLIVGSAAVTIYNIVSGVQQLKTWGIAPWGWQIIAALLLFSGILVFLYRIRAMIEPMLSGIAAKSPRGLPTLSGLEWVGASNAASRYADPRVIDEARRASIESRNLHEMDKRLNEEIFEIMFETGLQEKVAELQEKITENKQKMEKATQDASWRYRSVEMNFQDKLKSGEFIARGLIFPHMAGKEAVIIPAEEWDILEIDPFDNSAEGQGIKYIAVRIGPVASSAIPTSFNPLRAAARYVRQWLSGIGQRTPPRIRPG